MSHNPLSEEDVVECTSCEGGRWYTECCNGSGGCDCGGQVLDMGACNVCHGTGYRSINADVMANLRQIQGACFIGHGPIDGSWEGATRANLPFRTLNDE